MIYLDHNATTPILPEVLDAMMPPKEVDSRQLTVKAFLALTVNCKL